MALQTQKMLLGLLIFFSLSLFLGQLFLMNKFSMEGYMMTKQLKEKKELIVENELIDAEIARLQTQDFVAKTTDKYGFITKEKQTFVYIPLRVTAQK